jgi:uncharacterized damage-inducible protein DinB
MIAQPHVQLVRFKQWADLGLYDVVARNLQRLNEQDAAILMRILDHTHTVDRIFQHHLLGRPHGFHTARSDTMPDFPSLSKSVRALDDWYASYVVALSENDLDHKVDFVFTNGSPASMRRGEMVLHVCLHGAYHRGNAGIVLQKNGIAPNDDRLTDFLEKAA